MICRKEYYQLDDCDYGTFVHLIDWAGCSESHKQTLIKNYCLVTDFELEGPIGIRPDKPDEENNMGYVVYPKPKALQYNNRARLQENWTFALCLILIPVWLVVFPVYIAPESMPFVAAIILSCITSPALAILNAIIASVIGFFHDMIQESRYSKKKAKYDDQCKFENWIKDCRK